MEPFPLSPYAPPPAARLTTIHIDDHIIVANKPGGLLSVPGRGPEKAFCAVSVLSDRVGDVFTVHRLDMDTSGIIVFARTKAAQSRLSRAFQERQISKTYLAVVEGEPIPKSGEITFPIAAYSKRRPLRHIEEGGREAITHYETLETQADKSLIKLSPVTGRSHQLRLHMQAIGHPILGDRFYGRETSANQLMLHAETLGFPHPETKEKVRYFAPKPDYFQL